MTWFSLNPFDSILQGVQHARHWYDALGIRTAGSRLQELEQRIAEIVAGLASSSREEFFQDRRRSHDYWSLVDGSTFADIAAQFQGLRSEEVPRSLLRDSIKSTPVDPADERSGTADVNPRNFQMQLDLAARFSAAGIRILKFDDVQFEFQQTPFSIECKRLGTTKNVRYNLERAAAQLSERFADPSHRGLIALSLEKVLGLDTMQPPKLHGGAEIEPLVLSWTGRFLRDFGREFHDLDGRIIGAILLFRFVCHDLSHGGYSLARYHVFAPFYKDEHPDLLLLKALAESLQK